MADRPDDAEFFQDLHRFAFLLTRNAESARRIVTETVDEAMKRHRGHLEQERWVIICFQGVRQRALALVPPMTARGKLVSGDLPAECHQVVAGAEPEALLAALHGLPEPGRSALAMLLLKVLDADAIEKMLGIALPQLAEAVQAARVSLVTTCHGQGVPASL